MGLIVRILVSAMSARCAPGFAPEGVRPTGETTCVEVLSGGPDCTGHNYCPSDDRPHIRYPLRIHCRHDQIATLNDNLRLICRKKPSSSS